SAASHSLRVAVHSVAVKIATRTDAMATTKSPFASTTSMTQAGNRTHGPAATHSPSVGESRIAPANINRTTRIASRLGPFFDMRLTQQPVFRPTAGRLANLTEATEMAALKNVKVAVA